jgi:nucleoid-associated protein YejK
MAGGTVASYIKKPTALVYRAVGLSLTPAIIGRVTELHGVYYAKQWQFGPFFEAKVARRISPAFMGRFHEDWDRI